jgi:hypothetical protein
MTESSSTITTQYCTVRFTVGWLPSSVGFTDAAKLALASGRDLDKKVIRGSYAILGASRDPFIKQGAALKQVLMSLRDEYTIPEFTLRAAAGSGQTSEPSVKVKGSHIIETRKIEEFLSRFEEARQAYLRWGRQFQDPEVYSRIRNADEVALGLDWDIVSHKYPSADKLADSISCEIPAVSPFDIDFTLADVAPETARRLQEYAQARLTASIDGAMSELLQEFEDLVSTVAKNCGTRMRLMPPAQPEYAQYRDAEVVSIWTSVEDADIPADSVMVELQFVDHDRKNVGVPVKMLKTRTEFAALRAYETDEYRALTTSGFENLMWLTQRLANVKSVLAADPDEQTTVQSLVDRVTAQLANLGGSAADIAAQVKKAPALRQQVQGFFNNVKKQLVAKQIEVKTKQNNRRRAIVHMNPEPATEKGAA